MLPWEGIQRMIEIAADIASFGAVPVVDIHKLAAAELAAADILVVQTVMGLVP